MPLSKVHLSLWWSVWNLLSLSNLPWTHVPNFIKIRQRKPQHGKNLIYTFEKKWLHAPNLMKIWHMVYSVTPYNGHNIQTGHFVEYLKSNLQTGIKVTFCLYLMFLTYNPFLQLLFSNICHIFFFCQCLFRNNVY